MVRLALLAHHLESRRDLAVELNTTGLPSYTLVQLIYLVTIPRIRVISLEAFAYKVVSLDMDQLREEYHE